MDSCCPLVDSKSRSQCQVDGRDGEKSFLNLELFDGKGSHAQVAGNLGIRQGKYLLMFELSGYARSHTKVAENFGIHQEGQALVLVTFGHKDR